MRRFFCHSSIFGLLDAFEISVYKLKPDKVYSVYILNKREPVAKLKTNAKGMANITAIGPVRDVISVATDKSISQSRIFVVEEDESDFDSAVLISSE